MVSAKMADCGTQFVTVIILGSYKCVQEKLFGKADEMYRKNIQDQALPAASAKLNYVKPILKPLFAEQEILGADNIYLESNSGYYNS